MSIFQSTNPEFNDSEKTLLAKIAQSLSDSQIQPSVIATKAVVVGPDAGVPVKVLDANPKRRLAILQNNSGVTGAVVGGPNVNFSGPSLNGYPIYPQNPVNNPGPASRFETRTVGELWAASSGANFSVIEFLVP